jgi:hypothetical protein
MGVQLSFVCPIYSILLEQLFSSFNCSLRPIMIYALLHGLNLGLDLILVLSRTSSSIRMIVLLLKGSLTLNVGLVSRHSSISDDYCISVFLVARLLARGPLRSDTSSRRLS